ncbi:MAG: ASKHA domain-containing protein [Planctomycetota bacterium]|nr:ASKHA domain-containing protein [Planctomycetota bacterium]
MSLEIKVNGKSLSARRGLSIFECSEELGVHVPTSCNKNGKCRECIVEISEGKELLSKLSSEEEHLGAGFRLACRACLDADSGSITCHTMRRARMRIEESGWIETADADLTPAVSRDGDWVLLDGEPLTKRPGPLLGIALDLGTTTVVLRLLDLESGKQVAAASFENPQRFGGSDVMARIQYDSDHPGRLLQRTLLSYLAHCIEDLDCDPAMIYEIIVAGNTTMRDLLFGLDVSSVGQRPYRSTTEHELESGLRKSTGIESTAKKLRLPACPQARVVGLPLVSGHVGADAAACLLAVDLDASEGLAAIMDIGTNTELIVNGGGRLLAASCPAGPAFEGGAISCGMPGLEGAIESVRIDAEGNLSYKVIGDSPRAEGICGSGLVELLGELLRSGRMDHLGRLANEADRFELPETDSVYLSEEDISQLAQAKGANVSGLEIVMKNLGRSCEDLDRFYLAGGFASHLDLDSARRIGLIPDLPDEKITRIGNAAIEGATLALLSTRRRLELEETVSRIEHIELETDPDFFDHFVEGCQFKPIGAGESAA